MEPWLAFTFASILFSGLNTFLLKVVSQRNYDPTFIILIRYILWSVFALLVYIYSSWWDFNFTLIYILTGLWFIKMFTSYFTAAFKIEWMRYLDSTIFLPIYKTFAIIFITIISLFAFSESLSNSAIAWILLWLLVPILLINKKESKIQLDLKKWLLFTFWSAISVSIWATINKYVNSGWFNAELFTFLFLFFWIFLASYKYKKSLLKAKDKNYNTEWMYVFWLIFWLLTFLVSWTFIKALSWNLAVVYTMNSFSILIPIILSVIFYKEEMTFKKAFVIFLSIVSVILFI